MTSRERVIAACNFEEPDKVPIGLGATRSTTFHVDAYARLVRGLGYDLEPVRAFDACLMKAHIDMEMVQWMQADVIQLESVVNCFDIPNQDWKVFVTNLGNRIMVPGGFHPVKDEAGYYHVLNADGEVTYRMSPDGIYFDSTLATRMSETIDYTDPEAFVASLPMMHEEHVRTLERRAKLYYENTEYALHGTFVMNDLFGFNIGGHTYSDWLVLLVTEPDYCRTHVEAMVDWTIENLGIYLQGTGKYLHSVLISTADFGGQASELISPDVFAEVYVPAYRRISDYIHKNFGVKVMMHCCGSIRNLIPHMIEAGIDILNPVQTNAAGMKAEELKAEFDKKIVFWGGGMDTQSVLRAGTREEVREHVKHHIQVLGKGGGYVFTPNHNIQPDAPVENVIAMVEAAKECRDYPLI
ncbi:uroporphyrinogen decarboxylase family protein [Ruminococcus gauvreauii]|uniref:Uroporphyrinogen decarboxylase family protein n=1 Tax=Ruminococcus gauvreauii TaxID=438033 RepID=A0ABY5VDB1_9FIRM|nr:uroporphyrinogen decarboxylase family protein [Ruminococcus gauvreauii]UWP58307.1 uroporphyrinogen decarboxylase family protein [Ruminococcus gauvreauii]